MERGLEGLPQRPGERFVFAPQFATPHPSAAVNCAVPLDFNKDGWMDLLACHDKNSRPLLYRNNAGESFTEVGAFRADNRPRFRKQVVPPASGRASAAVTVQTTPGEPARFLVLNGHLRNDGPNQLIQYVP